MRDVYLELKGDDDQVLYETLKSGKASLIRAIYANAEFVNAMLVFCGRCSFHITRAASHFIRQEPDPNSIRKLFLPVSTAEASLKVQIVGCATPTTAVDYIRKFIEEHNDEIEQRRTDLAVGRSKDAYLLILSPSAAVNFYRPNRAREQLFDLIRPYTNQLEEFSEDYYKALNYYSLANYPLPFSSMSADCIRNATAKAAGVRSILESKVDVEEKINSLAQHIRISDPELLRKDLERGAIDKQQVDAIEHREEEDAELEEIRAKPMCVIELMTIVGSKGLSADHVIIIGFDNVNMGWW